MSVSERILINEIFHFDDAMKPEPKPLVPIEVCAEILAKRTLKRRFNGWPV